MTELIVALDGQTPLAQLRELRAKADVSWFKIGPQAMMSRDWHWLVDAASYTRIFLDLNLADARDTVQNAVKRFADAGVAAVSTNGLDATKSALEAADGRIKIWQWLWPSDKDPPLRGNDEQRIMPTGLHGVIVPGYMARGFWRGIDVVVPGIRFARFLDLPFASGGHLMPLDPHNCPAIGATHAVVGRPIWASADPALAAREFIEALRPPGIGNGIASCV